RVRAVALIALDIELALVAECAVEARPVHACRGREIVERSRGESILAKQIERLAERDLRLVGARPAATLWLRLRIQSGNRRFGSRWRLLTFLYHFAINSLTRFILCETV